MYFMQMSRSNRFFLLVILWSVPLDRDGSFGFEHIAKHEQQATGAMRTTEILRKPR